MFSKSCVSMLRNLLIGVVLLMLAVSVAHADDLLPDLAVARLRELQIEQTSDGHRLLRFTVVTVNIGAGRFEVRGRRPDTNSEMRVEQRIYTTTGTSRSLTTPATTFFAGDGHNHWHVRNFLSYELDRLDNGVKVGTGAKSGFCFYDNEPFGSLNVPVYTVANACSSGHPEALETKMGLSVGWGDRYQWVLVGQYIDITGLTPGRYRLLVIADPSGWFLETDKTNNSTWVDVQITGTGLKIESYGPTPAPAGSNLLRNRNFGEDANGDNRPDSWSSNSKFTRSSQVVFTGTYAGKLSATDNSAFSIAQTVNNITEHTTYIFSGAINIPSSSDTFTFTQEISWLTEGNTTISTNTIATYKDDTNGAWQQMTGTLQAPTGAHNARVTMKVQSLRATIYVDDFVFGPE